MSAGVAVAIHGGRGRSAVDAVQRAAAAGVIDHETALAEAVSAEWPGIRQALSAQLAKRGVYDDDSRSEAAGLLWENLLKGQDLALAIWRAAADVARGRQLVRRGRPDRSRPCDCGDIGGPLGDRTHNGQPLVCDCGAGCPVCRRAARMVEVTDQTRSLQEWRLELAADEGCCGWSDPYV